MTEQPNEYQIEVITQRFPHEVGAVRVPYPKPDDWPAPPAGKSLAALVPLEPVIRRFGNEQVEIIHSRVVAYGGEVVDLTPHLKAEAQIVA